MCGSGAGGGETEALRALAVAKMDVLSTSSSNGFLGVSSKGFLDEPAIAFGLSSASEKGFDERRSDTPNAAAASPGMGASKAVAAATKLSPPL